MFPSQDKKGHLSVALIPISARHKFITSSFHLPTEYSAYTSWVEANRATADLYFCPALRTTAGPPTLANVDPTTLQTLWADIDWQNVPANAVSTVLANLSLLKPTQVIQSGTRHREEVDSYIDSSTGDVVPVYSDALPPNYHVYFALSRPVDPATHRALNTALKNFLHADSKQANSSFLRIPGTMNFKSAPPLPVMVESRLSNPTVIHDPDDLASALPDVPELTATVTAHRDWTPTPLPSPTSIKASLRYDLKNMSDAEAVSLYKSRHGAVYAMTEKLYTSYPHLSRDQIHTLLHDFPPAVSKAASEPGYDVHRDVDRILDQLPAHDIEPPPASLPVHDNSPIPLQSHAQSHTPGLVSALPSQPYDSHPLSTYHYPLLPGVFDDLHAHRHSLPGDFVTLAALVSLSATMPRVSLEESSTKRTIASLFGVLVGAAGTRKSPALNYATYALTAADSHTRKTYMAELDAYTDAGDKEALAKHERVIPYIISNSGTPEFVMRHLNESTTGSLFLKSDEIRTMTTSLDRYANNSASKGSSGGTLLLTLWNGDPTSLDRVDRRNSRFVETPRLALLGGIQPKFIADLGNVDEGHPARYLCAYQDTANLGTKYSETPHEFNNLITTLYQLRATPRVWRMSTTAQDLMNSYRDVWNSYINNPVLSDGAATFCIKMTEYVARVALVLAETFAKDHTTGGVIDDEIIKMAHKVVNASLNSWFKAHPNMGETPFSRTEQEASHNLAAVTSYLSRVCTKENPFITVTQLRRARVAGLQRASSVYAVLRQYHAEYPSRMWWKPGRGPKGGVVVLSKYSIKPEQAAKLGLTPVTRDMIGDPTL